MVTSDGFNLSKTSDMSTFVFTLVEGSPLFRVAIIEGIRCTINDEVLKCTDGTHEIQA